MKINIPDSFDSFCQILESLKSKPLNLDKSTRTTRRDSSLTPREISSREMNIFDRLHYESLQLKNRQLNRQFESKKKRENQQRVCCTFRPNSNAITVIEEPEAFYQKNMLWLERRNKQMMRLQCEKADSKFKGLTLTLKTNKKGFKRQDKENKVKKTLGVQQFLQRYKKAREERKYKEERKVMPNGTAWNPHNYK